MTSPDVNSSGNAPSSSDEQVPSPAAVPMEEDPAVRDLSIKDALIGLENEISNLMIKTATGGGKSRAVVDPWKDALRVKRSDYQELVEMSALLTSGTQSTSVEETPSAPSLGMVNALNIVPSGLPLLQWPGFVRDDKREMFADIEECLLRFEDVLSSHSLNFDHHWYRLLPRCLGQDLRDWLNEFVKAAGRYVSWLTLKGAITVRYGVPKEQPRFGRIREFMVCTKGEQEPIDSFLERFKRLRAKSGVSDKHVISMVFFDAFPEAIARLIMVSMGQAEESCFYNNDYVSAVARRVDIA